MDHTLTFRKMTIADLDDIMEIEYSSFTLPWTMESFYNELINNKYAVYLVVEDGGKVVGYCGAWVIIDEAHITNIAILPAWRGRKLGEALLRNLMDLGIKMGIKKMTLEVRVSNYVAQSLYRKLGFKDGGIRRFYYTDNMEDALIMWVELS